MSTGVLGIKSSIATIEEYKILRANIIFSIPSCTCKIIGITSAEAYTGKSTTSLNLALTFAQTKARVLLIDCDLRKPRLANLVGRASTLGISNLLVNINSLEEVLQHVDDNLDMIFSGDIPPNPSELLGSDRMRDILDELSENYDYIFIDTPPVIVSDTVVLSKYLTGTVLVVRAGLSKRDYVMSAIEQLKFAGANLLGFVLNDSEAGSSKRTGGKNNKYYGYGRYKKNSHSHSKSLQKKA